MTTTATSTYAITHNTHLEGWFYGFLGVLGFSLTLPATRMAVASLDPLIVGLGRGVIAAMLAAPLLWITSQKFPTAPQWRSIFIVFIGAVVGFPLLSAWAMRMVPSSHGAILLGLLPLATAIAGTLRAHERPSRAFWIASLLGSVTVVGYAYSQGGGTLQLADLALLAAVVMAALSYAEGARVARELGGWQVICWALVLAAPILIGPFIYALWEHGIAQATTASWVGFFYIGIVSMFLAFFAWYRGLAVGGVARVSQLQLLQPFLTLMFSAMFLGETFGANAMLAAALVGFAIIVSRRTHIAFIRHRNISPGTGH
ncbi:MAG: DMT family transporter [Pseudomonadota bacterium]